MKIFDFELAVKMGHSKQKIDWLKKYCHTPISEDVFVLEMKGFKDHSNSKHKGKSYNPSYLRRQYQYLQREFGFFINPK